MKLLKHIFQILFFFPQQYHHYMAGLLVPPYGVMESARSADSKQSLFIVRYCLIRVG